MHEQQCPMEEFEDLMEELEELEPSEVSQAFLLMVDPQYNLPVSSKLENLSARQWRALKLALLALLSERSASSVH
jgi:hypothetical protein